MTIARSIHARAFRRWVAATLALVAWLMAADAWAHARSISYAVWEIDGAEAAVQVELSMLDANAIQATTGAANPEAWQTHVIEAVQLLDRSGACTPSAQSVQPLASPPGRVRLGWRVRCSSAHGTRRIRSDLLFDRVPSHVQLATVSYRSGEASVDIVLTDSGREATLTGARVPRGVWQSASQYVALGIEHILSGWDHLVFLVALLLLARSLKQVAAAVTGFTLGHSVTLSLAVLGFTRPDVRAVEALIGLSIAIVAAENVWLSSAQRSRKLPVAVAGLICASALGVAAAHAELALAIAGVGLFAICSFGLLERTARPERLRWAIAALFGLVHGFGFAGALQRLAPSTDQLAISLLGFNVGVELGQLGCVVLIWPLLLLARRRGVQPTVVQWGSAIAAGLGTYWFVMRTFS